jgi:AhpD family alkylhydroperoxidase
MSETQHMQPRLDYAKLAPKVIEAMHAVERYVRTSGLEPSLLELVKLRASQINGCAYCVDMHTKDARANGETEQRLYAVAVWKEAPFFTERERAALGWTEAVTLVSRDQVPDEVYEDARRQFDERQLIDLTMAVIAINGWNRLAVSFRALAGAYQPAAHHEAARER